MKNREIPTSIDFEIINVQPLNKFISDCEIKVFYHGKNRNGSYISKAVGNQIANTLPRSPIVAFYNEQIEDYEDHGQEIIINKHGVKFISKTVPYGAVSETSPIVWKEFMDADGTKREYMVCKGYLWTGRYPHLQQVLEHSKAESMEFFPESVVGDWAKFDNEEQEFFIFNEASISALCILGDDVEPCFEGSSIGKPEVLYSLKKDEFKKEFNIFMQELNEVLTHNLEEGGNVEVDNQETNFEETQTIVTEENNEFENNLEETVIENTQSEEFTEGEVLGETEADAIITESIQEFEDNNSEEETEEESNEEFDFQAEYTILKEKFEALSVDYEDIKVKYETLMNSKHQLETEEKKLICQKFAILGEEILSNFENNLDDYSIEELDEKLSAIAFKNGINFSLIIDQQAIITPNPQQRSDANVPAWIKAVDEKVNKDKTK